MLQNLLRKLLFIAGILNNVLLFLSGVKGISSIPQEPQKRYEENLGSNNETLFPGSTESTVILHQIDTNFFLHKLEMWGLRYATCNGKNQSPIDLNFTASVNQSIKNFKFKFYDAKPRAVYLTNTGYTVNFVAKWKRFIPFISGGPLDDTYIFEKGHFHWGKSDKKGSEHTIECKRYPLELHLIHYKKKYGSVEQAVKHEDGLAVIAIIFEITSNKKTGISLFSKRLRKLIKSRKKTVKVLSFTLESFNLNTNSQFLTYKGSLTTPPCSETVTWIISKQLSTVNPHEMIRFRKIKLFSGMKSNFRSLQWINKRKMYSFQAMSDTV